MAPADEEPARPPHHEAAPASVPSAPPIACSTLAAAASAAAAPSSSPPSSCSDPSAPTASPPPPASTAAAAAVAAAAGAEASPSPPPTQAPPAPRPPTVSPPTNGSPSTSAIVAPASQPRQNGDGDGDDAGPEPEVDNMSAHSAAYSATHHGVSLNYPASTAASSAVCLPSNNMASGQYVPYPTPADAYRASPAGTGAPMSLPSMRTMDSMVQQPVGQPPAAPHHTMDMGITSTLASVSSAPAFYAHHAMPLPSNYSLAHDAMSRFPLPHDPRILGSRGPKKVRSIPTAWAESSGSDSCPALALAAYLATGQHGRTSREAKTLAANAQWLCLQEIKRRAKTGCLTCRKRRIKVSKLHALLDCCPMCATRCYSFSSGPLCSCGLPPRLWLARANYCSGPRSAAANAAANAGHARNGKKKRAPNPLLCLAELS